MLLQKHNTGSTTMTILNENQLSIYTTKHGTPFQSQKRPATDTFVHHNSISSAIRYADKNLCTIVCVSDDEVIWSGGPVTALQVFNTFK